MIVCKAGHIHYLFLQNLLIFKQFNVACLSRRGYDVQQSSKRENASRVFGCYLGIMATGVASHSVPTGSTPQIGSSENTTTGGTPPARITTKNVPKNPGSGEPKVSTTKPNVTHTTNDTKPDEAVTPKPGNPTPKPNTPKKGAAGAVEYGYGIIVMPAILLIRG